MFAAACAIARSYTLPVIISYRNHKGECGAGIGSFVLINDQGHFVTAYHIVQQIMSLLQSNSDYNKLVSLRKGIEDDVSIKPSERHRQLNKNKIPDDMITDLMVWWGGVDNSGMIVDGQALADVDLTIGRFANYAPPANVTYPQFKDSSKAMEPGTSLCKMGFPLHEIKPTFDTSTKSFVLPAGAIPVPFFPLDGILTRVLMVNPTTPQPFPLMFIETSSPGLMGQSGGPTFDVHGAIWAIQSQTRHYPLGFGQDHKGPAKQTEFVKNQYLNVGWGIHSQTIIGFLQQHNVPFQLSPH